MVAMRMMAVRRALREAAGGCLHCQCRGGESEHRDRTDTPRLQIQSVTLPDLYGQENTSIFRRFTISDQWTKRFCGGKRVKVC